MATDISLNFGATLMTSPTGDLAVASGTVYGQQRVLRRLLTNPGDYLWSLDYGGGLPEMVGTTLNAGQINGIIFSQMKLEACVDQTVLPAVAIRSANDGYVYAEVQYADATTGDTSVLTLPL